MYCISFNTFYPWWQFWIFYCNFFVLWALRHLPFVPIKIWFNLTISCASSSYEKILPSTIFQHFRKWHVLQYRKLKAHQLRPDSMRTLSPDTVPGLQYPKFELLLFSLQPATSMWTRNLKQNALCVKTETVTWATNSNGCVTSSSKIQYTYMWIE